MTMRSFEGAYAASFTVPGTGGNYATEIVYIASHEIPTTIPKGRLSFDPCQELQLHIPSIVTSATVEVDILKPGGDPATAGDWRTAVVSYTAAGLQSPIALARVRGIRIRVKSGGNSGTQNIDIYWH